jgi:hypothetical protein
MSEQQALKYTVSTILNRNQNCNHSQLNCREATLPTELSNKSRSKSRHGLPFVYQPLFCITLTPT